MVDMEARELLATSAQRYSRQIDAEEASLGKLRRQSLAPAVWSSSVPMCPTPGQILAPYPAQNMHSLVSRVGLYHDGHKPRWPQTTTATNHDHDGYSIENANAKCTVKPT